MTTVVRVRVVAHTLKVMYLHKKVLMKHLRCSDMQTTLRVHHSPKCTGGPVQQARHSLVVAWRVRWDKDLRYARTYHQKPRKSPPKCHKRTSRVSIYTQFQCHENVVFLTTKCSGRWGKIASQHLRKHRVPLSDLIKQEREKFYFLGKLSDSKTCCSERVIYGKARFLSSLNLSVAL